MTSTDSISALIQTDLIWEREEEHECPPYTYIRKTERSEVIMTIQKHFILQYWNEFLSPCILFNQSKEFILDLHSSFIRLN